MKAIVCTKYGPPDVLQLRELEKPTPKNDEVLIRVHAATVLKGDCELRSLDFPLPFQLLMRVGFGFTRPRRRILGQELRQSQRLAFHSLRRSKRYMRARRRPRSNWSARAVSQSVSLASISVPRGKLLDPRKKHPGRAHKGSIYDSEQTAGVPRRPKSSAIFVHRSVR